MYPDTKSRISQLFQFVVPGFPSLSLAITMQEILEVGELAAITPIPFAPQFVLGLSKWRDEIVTVVDLALKLCGPMPPRQYTISYSHYLIAQVVLGEKPDVVAWPILSKAGAVVVPPRAFKAESPVALFGPMVHATVILDDRPVTVLNLEGLL